MSVNFFIPKKINVGFQERNGTYTGKLAYIIYFDEKGKLRKELSWSSWRDEKIDNEIFDNESMSGFVLNKKAGGYSAGWNHRQTYVRVYDPRGFEFEITVPNLLYILENATSTKGKGLEGDFVYGWDGKDLVLIPCDSPDWKELVELNELRHSDKKIGARDLKVGSTYRTKQNEEWIYMGRYDVYKYGSQKESKPSFWFYQRTENSKSGYFHQIKSVPQKLVDVISDDCVDDYADIFDKMEHNSTYSPIDETKTKYTPYTLEEVELDLRGGNRHWFYGFSDFDSPDGVMERQEISVGHQPNNYYYYKRKEVEHKSYWSYQNTTRIDRVKEYAETLEEVFNIVKPMKKFKYLANGKLYGEVTY